MRTHIKVSAKSWKKVEVKIGQIMFEKVKVKLLIKQFVIKIEHCEFKMCKKFVFIFLTIGQVSNGS